MSREKVVVVGRVGTDDTTQGQNKVGHSVLSFITARLVSTVSSSSSRLQPQAGPSTQHGQHGHQGHQGHQGPSHAAHLGHGHGHGHGHRHHRSPRPRQRSHSRSSSSPSPPPTSPKSSSSNLSREKRRSFSSRSPTGAQNRRQSKIHESSPLHTAAVLTGPSVEFRDGFSTQYGASASELAGLSESERGGDRYLGDETEVDTRRKRSSGDANALAQWAASVANASDPTLGEKRSSPPPSSQSKGQARRQSVVGSTTGPTLLPYRVGGRWGVTITRKLCEDAVLLGAVVYGVCKLVYEWDEKAVAGEISLLVGLSIIYKCFRFKPSPKRAASPRPGSPALASTPLPPNHPRNRIPMTSAVHSEDPPGVGGRGSVWGTSEKEYRDCLDDGVLFALLFAPMIASAMLHAALKQLASTPDVATHPGWAIEPPMLLPSTPIRYIRGMDLETVASDATRAVSALAISRRNLVQLFTLCSFVLLVQLGWSLRLERKLAKLGSPNDDPSKTTPATTLYWLRKGEWRRNVNVVGMAFLVSGGCLVVKGVTAYIGRGVWSDMSPSDVIIATLFYQFSLYVCVRLARRGFTLGELAVVCCAATAMFMESVNLTRMKIRLLRTPYIKTYRLPTPLLIFQLALIPGSLLCGFLLSPLLYLSRHLAQRPAHRLRFPHEKSVHRRLLALGFYGGAALVCGGLVGTWTRWCLGWRDPFLWVIYWLLEGPHKWTRPVLISYWGALAAIAVAAWSRQLSRARRHKHYVVPGLREPGQQDSQTPQQDALSGVAAQMMDAADQRMPTLSVNARRKSFHALAVVMFIPGIALDPAFTHLSFSVAFAMFNFAEYVRYFALWPFGASVHLFLNEFLDSKDSGTAILSHFYLLAGCASPLWVEGPSEVLSQYGVLSLGIGDALASVVGRRIGRLRWAPTSGKTVEGSVAFVASVIVSAAVLWAMGLIDSFKLVPFVTTSALCALLEAFSAQNDNLILPVYGWALGTLLGV